MAKSATVNPFAAAAKKGPSTSKKSSRPIFVADRVIGLDGKEIFSQLDIVDGIENYVKGHEFYEQGDAMKKANRPLVLGFTDYNFCQAWLEQGSRPENPKITSRPDGEGSLAQINYCDNVAKLDEGSFGQLAALIGTKNATEHTTRRHEFTINPEMLDAEAKVTKGGKVVEQNVMEAITEALQEKFSPSPEILSGLFTAKEVFHTNKGLIDRGLQLVAPGKTPADTDRLVRFLDAIRATRQIKPGAAKAE